ncbi:Retrotransposon gag protein [Gossypium australe]|uniref:Retrotransposon gag protein n=1 Tax=Gossypium australe TaxID=47621 RepID=A0A5B6W8Q4_9ROSI|nr:Retrotransposon gag protein [Gossypium australe]
MEFPFYGFDIILGMDWLTEHKAKIDFELKRVTLQSGEGVEIFVVGIRDFRTVKDYHDIFIDELLSLPLDCEVEFDMELYLGSSLVSITSYRLTPKDLKELRIQLQE